MLTSKEVMAMAEADFATQCAAAAELMYMRRQDPENVKNIWLHAWLCGRVHALREAKEMIGNDG